MALNQSFYVGEFRHVRRDSATNRIEELIRL